MGSMLDFECFYRENYLQEFLRKKIHSRPYDGFMFGDFRNYMQFHVRFGECN